MALRIRFAALFVLLAAAALTAGQTPAGQPAASQTAQGPETPTFKVQVDYVEVDALVTDQQGRFVRDLKKDDFQVFEDGKRQTVSAFTLVDIPIEKAVRPLFAAQAVEPDVKTNAVPFDGRIYIVVLDDLHVQPLHTQLVKRVMRKFISEKLGSNDLMAIVHVQGRSEYSQEFTSSKRLLLAAVDKFFGNAERPATVEAYQQYLATIGSPGQSTADPMERKRGFDARTTLDELKAIADWFGSVHGRKKSILFVSEGIEYDIEDMFGKQDASMIMDRTRELIRSASRSNVAIYAIDPRGLTDMGDMGIELNSAPAGGTTDDSGQVTGALTEQQIQSLGLRGLQNELRLQHNSMRTLAEETGGIAVINTNSFETTFNKIVEENSSYYVLAYYPPNPKRDGKFHNIRVQVNRPGLTVRARRGYANPSGKAPTTATQPANSKITLEARSALESPLPVSGLTMSVFAAPFKGTSPNASVLLGIELKGRDLKLDPGEKLSLSYFAVNAKGKPQASSTDTVTLNLRPETKARVEETGVRALTRFQVPPGRYQLRVAANQISSGTVGSVLYDLEVPDFMKSPLSMSGVALTSASASRLPTVRPDDDLRAVLPAAPMGSRVFPLNDDLALFAEVYDNAAGTGHKVDITTTVTSDEGKVLFKTEEARDSSEIQGKSGGYGFSTRVPLQGMPLGIYVLKVEARSRLNPNPMTSREIQFRIAEMATGGK